MLSLSSERMMEFCANADVSRQRAVHGPIKTIYLLLPLLSTASPTPLHSLPANAPLLP
jgi:hypothetical protein